MDAARPADDVTDRSVHRLAGSVFDLRFPRAADLAGDDLGQWHIVERGGELVAIRRIRPIKKLEHLLGGIRLALGLVHQNESRPRDWPRILAWLLGQDP